MTIIEAIFQGIVQGLTEFLPVSSSGHLSLVQHFTSLSGSEGMLFSILLHLGTLIAVFAAFYKTIWDLILEFFRMIGDIFTGKFRLHDMAPERRMILLLIVSMIPLLFFYFLRDLYASFSEDNDIIVEGICFLITSVMLFLSDRCVKGKKDASNMKYRDALIVGVVQGIAPMPGISRSGSTISAGLLCGLTREHAVAFSFIMGVPAVLGANVFELKDAVAEGISLEPLSAVLGVIVAAVVGFASIKMVNWLVKKDRFSVFAYYTLILGIITIAAGIAEFAIGHPLFQL